MVGTEASSISILNNKELGEVNSETIHGALKEILSEQSDMKRLLQTWLTCMENVLTTNATPNELVCKNHSSETHDIGSAEQKSENESSRNAKVDDAIRGQLLIRTPEKPDPSVHAAANLMQALPAGELVDGSGDGSKGEAKSSSSCHGTDEPCFTASGTDKFSSCSVKPKTWRSTQPIFRGSTRIEPVDDDSTLYTSPLPGCTPKRASSGSDNVSLRSGTSNTGGGKNNRDILSQHLPSLRDLPSNPNLFLNQCFELDESTHVGQFATFVKKVNTTSLPPTNWLSAIVHSKTFTMLCIAIIVSSIVCIAWDGDVALKVQMGHQEEPIAWLGGFADSTPIFVLLLLVELLLRVAADRWWYWLGPHWQWNVFDAIVLGCALLGSGHQLVQAEFRFKVPHAVILRIFRVVSLCREAHIGSAVEVFHSIRLMMVIILRSLPQLVWAFLMLFIVMLIFGTVFIHGISQQLERMPIASYPQDLKTYYNSFFRILLTLFMAVTGGDDWNVYVTPLMEINVVYALLFIFYVAFILIGVTNVVTGVFVDTAFQLAQRDRDLATQDCLNKQNSCILGLRELFMEADEDASGTLSWHEFKTHVKDERVLAYLNSLELDGSQVQSLFELLDVDSSGSVAIDEFVSGCMRLRGTAKSIDICALLYEFRRFVQDWTGHIRFMHEQLGKVEDKLEIKPEQSPTSVPFGEEQRRTVANIKRRMLGSTATSHEFESRCSEDYKLSSSSAIDLLE